MQNARISSGTDSLLQQANLHTMATKSGSQGVAHSVPVLTTSLGSPDNNNGHMWHMLIIAICDGMKISEHVSRQNEAEGHMMGNRPIPPHEVSSNWSKQRELDCQATPT